ncbi:MAG: heparinase II/III family protein [Planktomarina sp.]
MARSDLQTLGAFNRWRVRRAARGAMPKGFVSQPEPRTIGSYARGRQLLAGNIQFTGHIVELKAGDLWAFELPTQGFANDLHGFLWLDDLAAVGSAQARLMAQSWVLTWIKAYRTGNGPGWQVDLAARRLIRWIHHGIFLLGQTSKEQGDAYFTALGQHTRYVAGHWSDAAVGLPRFEALAGALYASLTVEGLGKYTKPMLSALAESCATEINPDGAIASRNPEELLEIFTLLNWASIALKRDDLTIPKQLSDALKRIAPTLRLLRHGNGHLTRFHGGGRGVEGRLDEALAQSGVRATAPRETAMGYIRVTAGSVTLIMDAAAPPKGRASFAAHASTAAVELTSGKFPLIVSCGSGVSFGDNWRLAGRATPSHSTLGIDGMSSSRFAPGSRGAAAQLLDVPNDVTLIRVSAIDGTRVQVTHDGYALTHGLTHIRKLDTSLNGEKLVGEDILEAAGPKNVTRLNRQAMDGAGYVPVSARFHVHPDVECSLDLNGTAVSMTQKNGDVWLFRGDGVAQLTLEPSVYLEQGRITPRAADQIVLSVAVSDAKTHLRWTLAKVHHGRSASVEKDPT